MNLHSQEINEISKALALVQGEIRAAQKDGANPHFKSKFASLHSHWEACRSILSKNGLAVTQLTDILEDGRDVLVTMLMHSSGQWLRSSMVLKPVKNDPQGMGSCLSYARRYMLSAIVGTTSDDDDDDAESAQGRGKTVPSPAPFVAKPATNTINANQSNMLQQLEARLPGSEKIALAGWIKNCFGVESLNQLPESAFEKVLDGLSKKLAQQREINETLNA